MFLYCTHTPILLCYFLHRTAQASATDAASRSGSVFCSKAAAAGAESVGDATQRHQCAAEKGPLVGAQRENITALLLSIRLKIDAQF